MGNQAYWRLAIAPYQPILRGLVFDSKEEASARAKEENRIGDWKGRGVKVIQCDELGNPSG